MVANLNALGAAGGPFPNWWGSSTMSALLGDLWAKVSAVQMTANSCKGGGQAELFFGPKNQVAAMDLARFPNQPWIPSRNETRS